MSEPERAFDPIGLLRALDRRRVAYIVIGALGRVIQGSGEVTDGLDIVPSTRPRNLERLTLALADLSASGATDDDLAAALDATPVLALETEHGSLRVVAEPAGTRGYEDLRRAASREPLGHGLRPQVASSRDLARMLAATDRDQDKAPLRRLRRLIELEHELGRSPGVER